MTPLDEDPYYDPNAPDWEVYDIQTYDEYNPEDDEGLDLDEDDLYDDDEEYEYFFEDSSSRLKKAAKDGFMMGVGAGIVNGILNN